MIGAGPGGYVCAIRAGQLGIDTVIVEARKPGRHLPQRRLHPVQGADPCRRRVREGRADRRGQSPLGISVRARDRPRKTVAWKDGIVGRLTTASRAAEEGGGQDVAGWARFRDGKTVEVETETGLQVIRAEQVVIATGSEPVELPFLPFGGKVISSTEALALTEVPGRLVVVGAGYIGLELGTAFAKLGAKVTVVEALARILPQYDAELTRPVAKRLGELGVEVLTGAKAKGLATEGEALAHRERRRQARRSPPTRSSSPVGRKPVTEGWGLEEIDLDMDGPFIRIDDQCRTSMRGVYAIGDVTGEPMLAHRAMAQGEMVAEIVAGHKRAWDKACIPAVCFTDPEIVTAGLSPEEAKGAGREVRTGLFPFQANGRAMTARRGRASSASSPEPTTIFCSASRAWRRLAELSAGFSLALEMGARLEDIAGTIHAHPTQSENPIYI